RISSKSPARSKKLRDSHPNGSASTSHPSTRTNLCNPHPHEQSLVRDRKADGNVVGNSIGMDPGKNFRRCNAPSVQVAGYFVLEPEIICEPILPVSEIQVGYSIDNGCRCL